MHAGCWPCAEATALSTFRTSSKRELSRWSKSRLPSLLVKQGLYGLTMLA